MGDSPRFIIQVASGTWVGDQAIDFRPYGLGMIGYPAQLDTNCVIGFQISPLRNTGFMPLYDKDNALVKVTPTGTSVKIHALPNEVFCGHFIRPVCISSDGTPVNQSAARYFELFAK